MRLRRTIAKTNRWLTNRLTRRFAGRIRPFAIVEHTGRRSGRTYRTPIMAFPSTNGFVIALTYGQDVDWLRNIRAQGGCTIEYRGQHHALTAPLIVRGDPSSVELPRPVRFALRLLRVNDFLTMDRASPPA